MGHLTYFSLVLSDILLFSPFPGAEADSCARDWIQNQGNCTAYFDRKLTWYQAEIECQSYRRGAHLASVLNKAETDLLAQHISAYQQKPSNVWIGLHDPLGNGRWRWADESVYNYKAWKYHQPGKSSRNEHCVELLQPTAFQKWNNALCRTYKAYICKYQL